MSRERIFEIIEAGKDNDTASKIYDFFMMAVIVVSLIPLFFKTEYQLFRITDYITTGIFIIDYLLRLITADYKLKGKSVPFLRYPFTPMALIDLLCILPTFVAMSPSFKVLKVLRMIRTFKVFRLFKGFRYSSTFEMIARVLRKQKRNLIAVCVLAIGYILVISLIIFNVEPETFNTFFDALYWATISLTTMGYGDIYATSTAGQVITMLSALFGIAIVALPAGIISAGFIEEINKRNNND